MNFMKRARISVTRNYKKTILLLILTFLLGSIVAGAIIIEQAINNTAVRVRQSILPVVTAAPDLEMLVGFGANQPQLEAITREVIHEISELPYVSHIDYSISFNVRTQFHVYDPVTRGAGDNLYGDYNFFWLNGVSTTQIVQVEEGLFELAEGRLFTEEDLVPLASSTPTPILIPRVIAEMNGISLGETINLYQQTFVPPLYAEIPEEGLVVDEYELWEHPYNIQVNIPNQFVVIGLLDIDYHRATHMENIEMQRVVWNTFLVPNWKVESIILTFYENNEEWRNTFNIESRIALSEFLQPTVFWVLSDSIYMEQFIEAAEPILPDFYRIDTWRHVFNPLEGAMETMHWIARQVLLFAIAATLIILSLLITLYLRDRKQEIGIYLALGEKKEKIFFQIAMEVVFTSLISMTIAIFLGNITSSHFSERLLRQELAQEGIWTTGSTSIGEWEVFSELEFMGMGREMTISELAELFEISLNGQSVVIFYGIGFITILFSIIIPVTYALKLNLKRTLMQAKIG